ncbi:MFS transporter [Croceibacterium salegens]|uniref:MFS transporter n=1 Tax=Croceibacterium salegens TaxID=1737568 RepID=UPI000B08FE27|nr:MFS transporter [Croceibacterium salegens]
MVTALRDRRAASVFVLGVIAVTAGVALHLPMFMMAQDMGYRLYGMPMGQEMVWGMALIIGGIGIAAYGLLPRNVAEQVAASREIVVSPPEDLPLTPAHWRLMLVLVIALVIDVMKPSSLGFTIPGMVDEYRVGKQLVSLVPLSALLGTVTGSVLWGLIADVYGRKASILLSAVVFVGTSICGAMPSLAWNIAMCFIMGLGAGGMLPVTYALLAEMMPSKHRGWSLVLVGGLGSVGGYFAASGLSAVLVPTFSWRVLWLANLPTGLALVLLGGLIPESAKFLLARGRKDEARKVMALFGSEARRGPISETVQFAKAGAGALTGRAFVGKLLALSLAATCYGLINFGLLLWLPADLVAKGYSMELSSSLLAKSALIALPTIFIAAWGYSRWSTKGSVIASLAVTVLGLLLVLRLELAGTGSPVIPVALLIIGTNALIAMLLPYAAESFPMRIRGRTTGVVAACSKGGGMLAQVLAVLAMVPALGAVSIIVVLPTVAALLLVAWFGQETRGRDLRDLDPDGHTFDGTGI